MQIHFFFFGCWNRDIIYRDMITDRIMNDKYPYNFGLIGGDNFYYNHSTCDSTDCKRKYYKSTFYNGFERLKKICHKKNVSIYAVLGNHNVISKKIYNLEMEHYGHTRRKQDFIDVSLSKNNRLEFVIPKKTFHPNKLSKSKSISIHHFYSFDVKNIRVILIDTNIFRGMDIYSKSKGQNNLYDISKKIVEQVQHGKINFIIGHEPFYAYRPNNETNEVDVHVMNNGQILLDMIYEKINMGIKIIYLCSDVHTFQYLNVFKNKLCLPIIVCGTGGGIPDYYVNSQKCNLSKKILKKDGYTIKLICIENPFGYLHFSIDTNDFLESTKQISNKDHSIQTDSTSYFQYIKLKLDTPKDTSSYLQKEREYQIISNKSKGNLIYQTS